MKTLVLILTLLFSLCGSASIYYYDLGLTANQIIHYGERSVVINSGYRSQPSLSLIHWPSDSVSQYLLPVRTNPYSGIVIDQQLYMSHNFTDELVNVDLSRLNPFVKKIEPQTLFSTPSSLAVGAETVIHHQNQLWMAYSNVDVGDDYIYGSGFLAVFDYQQNQFSAPKTITFEEKNSKNIISISENEIAISTGTYEKEDGKVLVLDTKKLPSQSAVFLNSKSESVTSYNTKGTPGDIAVDGNTLWVCDLENRKTSNSGPLPGQLFEIDQNNNTIRTHQLPFPVCNAVLAKGDYLYVTNFYAGINATNRKHLYVFNKNTMNEVCSIELHPPGTELPLLAFAADLSLHTWGGVENLLIVLSQTPHMARLSLNGKGLPLVCNE